MITQIPIEHRWPIGTTVRYVHGRRDALIEAVRFAWVPVYDLRYVDNDQRSSRPIEEVDNVFVEVSS